MNKLKILITAILLISVTTALGYQIKRQVISPGGTQVVTGDHNLKGTIGQSITSNTTSNNYYLGSGFWSKGTLSREISISGLISYSCGIPIPNAEVCVSYGDTFSVPIDYDSTGLDGIYEIVVSGPGLYDISVTHSFMGNTFIPNIPVYGDTVINIELLCFKYLPGDVNMFLGLWPPRAIGAEVTYLVNYFKGSSSSVPCYIYNPCAPGPPGQYFWASADCNGDCRIIGSDVVCFVRYFRGEGSISWCEWYPPCWLSTEEAEADGEPPGWANCQTPPSVTGSRIISTKPGK